MIKYFYLVVFAFLLIGCSTNGNSSQEVITATVSFYGPSDIPDSGYFSVIQPKDSLNPVLHLNYSQYLRNNPEQAGLFKSDTIRVDLAGAPISYEVIEVHDN